MPMARRLRPEDVVTMGVLADRGQSARSIARQLDVDESMVRYPLRRRAEGAADARRGRQVHRASVHAELIARSWQEHESGARPPIVHELHDLLVEGHGYGGSYQSVRRYVRAQFPAPRRRAYRRVETVPGAQAQSDWGEYPRIRIRRREVPRSLFVMVLSHSRWTAGVWSPRKDLVAWLTVHNEAFRRLDGIPAVNRIDNVKTAIVRGAGAWGVIHPTFRTYARTVGFHVDACAPRAANAKGKTEAKVRLSRLFGELRTMDFECDEHLQQVTDARLRRWSERAICPATGRSVAASWEEEKRLLRPLPLLPEPFDIAVTRPVRRDCTVAFEGRSYTVPFAHVGREVEVRGCAGTVQVVAGGVVVVQYPRATAARILIDTRCCEGQATDRVLPPLPLGRMGRRLEEIRQLPVEERPLDLYGALAEVAR